MIIKEIKIPVEIVSSATYTGATTLAKGTAYEATVSQSYWELDDVGEPKQYTVWGRPVQGWERDGIGEITATVTGLPEGLTFDAATGKITGTPTTAGEYNVTINYAIKTQSTRYMWGNLVVNVSTMNAKSTVKLTVGELVTVTVDGVATKVEKGSTLTLEAPEAPEGMKFDGWYNGETKFDLSQAVNEDLTLTAKFVAIPDEIEFRVQIGRAHV